MSLITKIYWEGFLKYRFIVCHPRNAKSELGRLGVKREAIISIFRKYPGKYHGQWESGTTKEERDGILYAIFHI